MGLLLENFQSALCTPFEWCPMCDHSYSLWVFANAHSLAGDLVHEAGCLEYVGSSLPTRVNHYAIIHRGWMTINMELRASKANPAWINLFHFYRFSNYSLYGERKLFPDLFMGNSCVWEGKCVTGKMRLWFRGPRRGGPPQLSRGRGRMQGVTLLLPSKGHFHKKQSRENNTGMKNKNVNFYKVVALEINFSPSFSPTNPRN